MAGKGFRCALVVTVQVQAISLGCYRLLSVCPHPGVSRGRVSKPCSGASGVVARGAQRHWWPAWPHLGVPEELQALAEDDQAVLSVQHVGHERAVPVGVQQDLITRMAGVLRSSYLTRKLLIVYDTNRCCPSCITDNPLCWPTRGFLGGAISAAALCLRAWLRPHLQMLCKICSALLSRSTCGLLRLQDRTKRSSAPTPPLSAISSQQARL